jgi:hypothetical protein
VTAKGGGHAHREGRRVERRQAKQAKRERRRGGPSYAKRTDTGPANDYGGPGRQPPPDGSP